MLNVKEIKKLKENNTQSKENENEITHIFIYWD